MGERARSERWIDECAALHEGGPSRRLPARCWMRKIEQDDIVVLHPALLVARAIADAVEPAPPPTWYAEVALYPADVAPGALPLAIVPFPVEVGTVVQRHGELTVRGEPGAGRGLVAVLADGTAVGCAGPASPPPAFRRKRVRW